MTKTTKRLTKKENTIENTASYKESNHYFNRQKIIINLGKNINGIASHLSHSNKILTETMNGTDEIQLDSS